MTGCNGTGGQKSDEIVQKKRKSEHSFTHQGNHTIMKQRIKLTDNGTSLLGTRCWGTERGQSLSPPWRDGEVRNLRTGALLRLAMPGVMKINHQGRGEDFLNKAQT